MWALGQRIIKIWTIYSRMDDSLNEIMDRVKKGIKVMAEPSTSGDTFADINEKKEMPPIVNTVLNTIMAVGIIGILVCVIAASGAARLSLCYNSYLGTTEYKMTLVYAALAFVFFPLYYVYYALVLNPICLKRIGRR